MNVLILGNGDEEHGWAIWLLGQSEHRLDAAFPGFGDAALAGVPAPRDLDDALARAGVEVVIVGGPIDSRGEALRRAAAEGLAIICLHPPGDDSEAYYQVALSRDETGAAIVPDLPFRLHPGVDRMRRALATNELGAFRGLRLEAPCLEGKNLVRETFARAVDAVRALVGEIEALTATGDPPGVDPDLELVVQLRAAGGRRAELRAWCGPSEPSRLTLQGAMGSLTLDFETTLEQPLRLIRRESQQPENIMSFEPWDPHGAIFSVLLASRGRHDGSAPPSPNIHDGTRAMELVEATVRSLRRGRTVDLHYEPISEESSFKSVMTSTGCMILVASFFAVLLALSGPPLGFHWTIYIAYVIPPILVIFMVMQVLRFAVRRPKESAEVSQKDAR
jgi:myo-inositol 2-dehydrogenase/D-chiro-inositol 1-dehydrogenase